MYIQRKTYLSFRYGVVGCVEVIYILHDSLVEEVHVCLKCLIMTEHLAHKALMK